MHCCDDIFDMNSILIWNVVAQSSASHMPLAAAMSRGVNGKRKHPPGCPAVYNPATSSIPANSVPQCTNFAFEKRQCRPVMSAQSQEPNFAVNNFAGLSFAVVSYLH